MTSAVKTRAESLRNKMCRLTPESIIPFDKRLWLERIPPQDLTEGGLKLPVDAQKDQAYGVVLKIADGIEGIAVDDIVMFEAYSGQEISFLDRTCLLLEYDQVKAKIIAPS